MASLGMAWRMHPRHHKEGARQGERNAMTGIALIGAIVCVGALYVLLPVMVDAHRRFRGTRLVTCPEAKQSAAVEVDAMHAAVTAAVDGIELRLRACSRWPERLDCGQ